MAKEFGKLKVEEAEPNLASLMVLFEKHKNRRSRAEIFDLWKVGLLPDQPKITFKSWISYVDTLRERAFEDNLDKKRGSLVDQLDARKEVSLVQIENKLKQGTVDLIDTANDIMEDARSEEGAPLKERYFALAVVTNMWKGLQKEKEIAIKAHAEKRESVGMFAKLLRGTLSGEFSMQDVENLRGTLKANADSIPTIEGSTT